MHDGYKQGRQDVAPIDDKRFVGGRVPNLPTFCTRVDARATRFPLHFVIVGTAFVSSQPPSPTACMRVIPTFASVEPFLPARMTGLVTARELTNGFANRFLVIWAERSQICRSRRPRLKRPLTRWHGVFRSSGIDRRSHDSQDGLRLEFTSLGPKWRYGQLYRGPN